MRERDAVGLLAEWRERFAELFAGHEGTVVVGNNGAVRGLGAHYLCGWELGVAGILFTENDQTLALVRVSEQKRQGMPVNAGVLRCWPGVMRFNKLLLRSQALELLGQSKRAGVVEK